MEKQLEMHYNNGNNDLSKPEQFLEFLYQSHK